ncbi:hypothetical protein AVEN_172977-1 [Araneus ventricosus]|uniref:Pre-C2HC domain-containing protein n=1 Tax=Araneus ventricosus TaxID=182803 RepID=A0A4Y2QB34_ARAVE|nr:hypothetical protein AVEN_172977-1 [Araneus ventricosus]
MESSHEESLKKMMESSKKAREGSPPNEFELNICRQIQEQESCKIQIRKNMRLVRKRVKKAIPNSEEHMSARAELGSYNRAIANVNGVKLAQVAVPIWIIQHWKMTEYRPPATRENKDIEFQLVSPRKATEHPSPVKTTSPIKVGNRFQNLTDIPAETKSYPATINLKPKDTYKTLLKEIAEFPGIENKLLYGYINIKPTLEENRQKIIQLLKEKKEEFMLLEASEDRPIKVVLKGLHADTNSTDIVEDLQSKSFTVNRFSQMRNYKLQKPLDTFLIEIKKAGHFQNIFNLKELGYVKINVEPYRKKNKATICYN